MKEDKAGNIWFATNGRGVYCYNGRSLTNISDKDGLCSNFVNCILEDNKGNLWFATQHEGVSRYQPSAVSEGSKSFTTFTYQDGMNCSEVWTMCEDKTGNIWLSAQGNICRYDPSATLGTGSETFTNFPGNTEDHITLVRNYVQSIFADRKGNLWLGCSGGLYRIDTSAALRTGSKSFINLTRAWALGEM